MEVSDEFSAFIFMGRVFEWAYVVLSFICWSRADSLCDLPTFEINTSEVQIRKPGGGGGGGGKGRGQE
jgi:hypothetical protein